MRHDYIAVVTVWYQVTAKGSSDVPVCWMFDAYLNLAKLIGQFCGSCLDVTKGRAFLDSFYFNAHCTKRQHTETVF